MRLEDLGLIGNCQFAALVDRRGAVVWCCLPRFDSEPVFASLLDEEGGGEFLVGPADGTVGTQRYLDNTNVLETRFDTPDGSFRILDFAPRFELFDRSFRPKKIVRIVEPLEGTPRIRIACDPRMGWSSRRPEIEQGSNHVSYGGFDAELRLTTDVPLSYLNGLPFALTAKKHIIFSWGAPVEEPLEPLCERFRRETIRYWQLWVKRCHVPPMYQAQVIRSALALKLHCFEDTGAIIAATTTSLPEAPGTGRNWDYRYCWMRDAYYAIDAFRELGCYEEREQFMHFLLNVASGAPDLDLAPLYRVDGRSDLEESVLEGWPGYQKSGPVRIGNGAHTHQQNDIFGELVLALSPLFLDERFREDQTHAASTLFSRLAEKAIAVAGQPDAGIWEYRRDSKPQTFSALMCWAAAGRMAGVAARFGLPTERRFREAAEKLKADILSNAWNTELGALAASYGGAGLDASVLQTATLRFFDPSDPRGSATVDVIRDGLDNGGWLRRYAEDDIGDTTNAFVICTFWLVEALAAIGRGSEARTTLELIISRLPPLGLVAEDVDPKTGLMWGNFPQAYSHVGLIRAAFAASPDWREIL
ncbi:MAG: glycoside hydrolase family 15 protein [Proteobacteria bacterium]|jgi:GH15 family glucan-1,4-alpha-glucosidase|nr:glycoside hydrolase family 15 protein [Pseudomonadota bacterium]